MKEKSTLLKWVEDRTEKGHVLFLDGSFATELEKSVDFKNELGWTAFANFDYIDKVRGVYERFINIGCDIITTNTYHHSLRLLKQAKEGHSEERIVKFFTDTVSIAQSATFAQKNEGKVLILVSVGPFAVNLRDGSEYTGLYPSTETKEKIAEYYDQQIKMVKNSEYNGVIFETIPSKIDIETILAKCEGLGTVIVSLSLNKLALRDGTPLKEVIAMLLASGNIDGVSINCSDPRDGEDQIKEIVSCGWKEAGRFIFIYPNSGETYANGEFGGEPVKLDEYVKKWHEAGAVGIGGCCRVGIDELMAIRKVIYQINGVTTPPIRCRPSPNYIHPPCWFEYHPTHYGPKRDPEDETDHEMDNNNWNEDDDDDDMESTASDEDNEIVN